MGVSTGALVGVAVLLLLSRCCRRRAASCSSWKLVRVHMAPETQRPGPTHPEVSACCPSMATTGADTPDLGVRKQALPEPYERILGKKPGGQRSC